MKNISFRFNTIRKKLVFGLVLIFIFSGTESFSQSQCGTPYSPPPNQLAPPSGNCVPISSTNKYNQQAFYVPTLNDPLITVKVTFHCFSAPNQGFGSTAQSYQDINTIKGHITFINGLTRMSYPRNATYMSSWTSPQGPYWTANYGNPPGLMDSRVVYEVTNIYFYPGTSLYTSTNGQALWNYISSVDPSRLNEGIPIIFNGASFPGGYSGIALTASNGMPYVHTNWGPGPAGVYAAQQHLRHEIGHHMDWWHTYDTELNINPCGTHDFLYDVFPQNNPMCASGSYACNTCYEDDITNYSNNTMTKNPILLDNNWISPLQMGRRIRALHLNPVRMFAKDMKSENQHPWLITSNETWDFDIQMYRDVVVKAGNTLTIKCRVAMATDGKIIVEKGAKLIIDGGEVTGWCKTTPAGSDYNMPLWTGIEVDGDPTQVQTTYGSGYSNQGIVKVINGGKISYAYKGINTSRTTGTTWQPNTSGGIVIVDNAVFENNVFDIIFYKYYLGNVQSQVINSTFQTTSLIGLNGNGAQIAPGNHIKLYQNAGLNILACSFNYLAGGVYSMADRGQGIYTTDSDFNVDHYCPTPPCTNPPRCQFNSLKEGVYIDNSNPLFTGVIQHSDFTDCATGMLVENSYYCTFSSCNVKTLPFYTGVYLYKSKYYNVNSNNFYGTGKEGTGVVAFDSQDGAHQIFRNFFYDHSIGISCIDNNGGQSSETVGLRMNCNHFDNGGKNLYDIALTTQFASIPVVNYEQGNPSPSSAADLVRNVYGAGYINPTIPTKWNSPTIGQLVNHPSSVNGVDDPNFPLVQASSQLQVSSYNFNFVYSVDCAVGSTSWYRQGQSQASGLQKLENLNNQLNDLKTNDAKKYYFGIQAAVASKLGVLMTEAIPGKNDSIIGVLSSNPGSMTDTDIQSVFAFMRKGDYNSAIANINNLPAAKSDWKGLLSKLIEIEQREGGIYSLTKNGSDVQFLKGYAETEGKNGQACAQTILKLVFGKDHMYPKANLQLTSAGFDNATIQNSLIKLYPNPTSDIVTIQFQGTNKGGSVAEIKDVLGKVIYTQKLEGDKENLNVKGLINGVYLLNITQDNKTIYQTKLVKQN
jgi:hypothetical protein